MPGQTNNADILSGLNQLIQALNDLDCQGTTPQITLPQIRIIIETSTGEDTAPLDDETLSETDPPPVRYIAKDVNDDACKRAHFHYDGLYAVIEKLDQDNVVFWAGSSLSFLVAMTLTVFYGPFAFIGGASLAGAFGIKNVVGYVVGIAAAIYSVGPDFTAILLALLNRREDIICHFYNEIASGGSVFTARQGLYQILDDEGLGVVNKNIVYQIYNVEWALTLFHDAVSEDKELIDGWSEGATTSATVHALDGYTPTNAIDCATCNQSTNCIVLDAGIEVSATATTGTYNSVQQVNGFGTTIYRVTLTFAGCYDPNASEYVALTTLTNTSGQVANDPDTGAKAVDIRDGFSALLFDQNCPALCDINLLQTLQDVHTIDIRSTQAFQVSLEWQVQTGGG